MAAGKVRHGHGQGRDFGPQGDIEGAFAFGQGGDQHVEVRGRTADTVEHLGQKRVGAGAAERSAVTSRRVRT